VPRITDYCICVYVFGCRLSLFRLGDSDLGITPLDYTTIGITCTVFCFHIAHISFASSWYLLCFFSYCFGKIMCIRDSYDYQIGGLCFFIRGSYVGSVSRYCFIRNYAAIQYSLNYHSQYIGSCVFILWAFALNQFSCFCQFLMDNFCYSIMYLYILGRC
jgi:hypothetical protein